MKIFLIAPFTGMLNSDTHLIQDQYRTWLEKIIRFLESKGYQVISKHVREKWGKNLEKPEVAIKNDFDSVKKSDLIVAYLGNPFSPGVQMELGIALCNHKKIIILTEWDSDLPYLVKGLPQLTDTIFVKFKDEEDLIIKLDNHL
jgi:nucleoside 2-deoxyribosyltransferase